MVHDLAFQTVKIVHCLAFQLRGKIGGPEAEFEQRRLVVVDEMVGVGAAVPVKPLVFQHAIEQRARRAHPAPALSLTINGARQDAQRLRVALEAAVLRHQPVQDPLARVAERRMADIVGKADRLDQVEIDGGLGMSRPQPDRNRFGDAGDFQRMGQACAVKIVFARLEDLGLRLQPAKRGGEHHPVAVLVEDAAVIGPALAVPAVPQVVAIKVAVKIIRHSGECRQSGFGGRCGLSRMDYIREKKMRERCCRSRGLGLLSPQ